MNWLADHALPIWIVGAIALTMAFIVFIQTRASGALVAIIVVVAITASLLLLERYIETPREAVERSLYEVADRVEANDMDGALSYLAPTADAAIRKEIVETMPQFVFEVANVLGEPKIDVDAAGNSATVECRGVVVGKLRRDGMKVGADDRLTLQWIRQGDRWLIESYTSAENWGRAANRRRK